MLSHHCCSQINVVLNFQLTSDGYFSFGREAHLHNPVLFPESDAHNYLVAPYWVNFDIRESGLISYEVHTSFTALMSSVNNYIQQQEDEDFVGTWMMIGHFKEAPQDGSTENTVMTINLLYFTSYAFPLTDKHFTRHHYHEWEPILCCVYILVWCFVKK